MRAIALKTGGLLHVRMGQLELGWSGRKRERAAEAQREWAETGASAGKHARRDLYHLWGLTFSPGIAMLCWWKDSSSETRPAWTSAETRGDNGTCALPIYINGVCSAEKAYGPQLVR